MIFDVFQNVEKEQKKSNKRERQDTTQPETTRKVQPFNEEDMIYNYEAQQQREILSKSHPYRSRQTSSTEHRTNKSTRELKRSETKVIKPPSFDSNLALSLPMPSETQFTIEYENPRIPIPLIDQGRDYSDKLGKWVPCSWNGIMQMPIGTWIQYTSNVYQKDTRKKICGIKGDNVFVLPNSITIWSTPRLGSDIGNEKTTEYTRITCGKGRHVPFFDENPQENFTSCHYCKCRGWALTEGGQTQNRRFYVMPWSLKSTRDSSYGPLGFKIFN